MRSIVQLSFAGLMLACAVPAMATASLSTFAESITESGDYSSAGGTSFASVTGASASISPNGPTLSAQAVSEPGIAGASASARLLYNFSINLGGAFTYSPDGSAHVVSVPLVITYAGRADGGGGFSQAVIDLTVRGASGTQFEDGLNCSPDSSSGCGSISRSSAFDFAYLFDNGAGQVDLHTTGEIEMYTYASAQDLYGSGFEAYADLDPTLSIDPTFAAAHPEFSLTVETLPAAPVPEPGEWAMMIAGLGLVGGVARRRRASARTRG